MNKKYNITLASPQGFCGGVKRAIKLLNDAINNKNIKKPIYMLGSIVHNNNVTNSFIEKGVKLITKDDIKDISEGTIVVSAHGVSPKIIKEIENKNLDIIDTTCEKIREMHNLINSKVKEGYQIAFLGKATHDETLGVLGLSDNVKLIENDSITNYQDKTLLVCQTTLCFDEVENKFLFLKEKYPNLELANEICNATKTRQSGAINASKNADLVLVVGDKTSNNCNTLVEVIKINACKNTYMISSISDLENIDFTNIKNITITSAASTPDEDVIDILNFLNK